MAQDTAVQVDDLGGSDPDQLARIAARTIGVATATWSALSLTEVPYDIPTLTTRGRYRIHGRVSSGDPGAGVAVEVSVFVMVVQSWAHSPFFQFVPPEFRAMALADLPWEIEPLVYRTDLGKSLPPGLRMATAYSVLDLGPDAAAIWMEDVPVVDRRWGYPDYDRAARLLGRFATRRPVAEALEAIRSAVSARTVRDHVHGRVALQVLPALRVAELWEHPSVARHFFPLRPALLEWPTGCPPCSTRSKDCQPASVTATPARGTCSRGRMTSW